MFQISAILVAFVFVVGEAVIIVISALYGVCLLCDAFFNSLIDSESNDG